MRAVRTSIVLFLAVAVLVVLGSVMNHRVCRQLRQRLEDLPPQVDEVTASEFESFELVWHRWRGWLRFTLNAAFWRTANDLVGDVCAYGRAGSQAEYDAAKGRLTLAIQEMSRPGWAAH